ncbi:hypothetical protein BDR05DRAFT_743048 [Suillus weaverae]|nr:hypothetical protein BDR05DRAFT_743048 [Suillus weaverae]
MLSTHLMRTSLLAHLLEVAFAEFALLRLWSKHEQPRGVCVEPYQEMVDQRVVEWRRKFSGLKGGKKIVRVDISMRSSTVRRAIKTLVPTVISLSPNNRLLASVSNDATAHLWNLDTNLGVRGRVVDLCSPTQRKYETVSTSPPPAPAPAPAPEFDPLANRPAASKAAKPILVLGVHPSPLRRSLDQAQVVASLAAGLLCMIARNFPGSYLNLGGFSVVCHPPLFCFH